MSVDRLIKSARDTTVGDNKGTKYEKLKRGMQGICASLNYSSKRYEPDKTIKSIKNYIKNCNRILYSEITAFIFSLNEEQRGIFISNVEQLLIYSMESKDDMEVQGYILKIYDHVHLAICQIECLQSRVEDDTIKGILLKDLEPVKVKLENQIEEKAQTTQKELYTQLISLIGIFTAMAFLIFGSLSALDNVFGNFANIPLVKVIIIACIWGLCVLNLICIFMFFVSKMTKLELEKRNYLVIAWSNLILICILLSGIWFYYIKSIGINEWFDKLARNNEVFVTISGFGIVLILFLVSVVMIIKTFNKKEV